MDTLLANALNLGVGYKVYAIKALQNTPLPYGTYRVVTDPRFNSSGGQGTVKNIRYQIDVYAATKAEAETIGADIETNILASADFIPYVYQSFTELDDESKDFRYILDFTIGKN